MFPILNNVFSQGVTQLINGILINIAIAIFKAITGIYSLFYGLATTRLFRATTIEAISNRIYILVSVVILFAFSVKLIEAIVNPDMLTDAKKGVTGVLKRTIIGLLLLVAVPAIFNFVYYLQAEIIVGGVVEKLMLGYMDSDSSSGIEGAGGTLTSAIITSFIRPVDQNGVPYTESSLCNDDKNCNYADKLADINSGQYEPYLTFLGGEPNFDNLHQVGGTFAGNKIWENGEPIYDISAFALVIVGGFILYQVIILCLDAGLRLVKLGILEVLAPVMIVSYIASGKDHLSKWAEMTVKEFTSILIRIAGLCFMIMGFQLMNEPDSIFNNDSVSVWFKIFLIIGLLRLVKELPDILGKLFGAPIKMGGIKDKLGEMAGIGKMAQNAWAGMGGLAKAGAVGLGAGAVGIGKWANNKFADSEAGKKLAASKLGQKLHVSDKSIASQFASSRVGRGVIGAGKVAGAAYKSGGKGTAKAVAEEAKKQFATQAYDMQEKEKARKKLAQAKAINSASTKTDPIMNVSVQGLKLDAKGKLDFDASAKPNGRTLSNAEAKSIKDDVINNIGGISKDHKKILSDHNENMNKANSAQRKSDLQKDLIDQLTTMKSLSKDTSQQGEIQSLITGITSGALTSTAAIQSKMDHILDENVFNGSGCLGEATRNQYRETVAQAAQNAQNGQALGVSQNILDKELADAKDDLNKSNDDIKKLKESTGGTELETIESVLSAMEKFDAAVTGAQRADDMKAINDAVARVVNAQGGTTTQTPPPAPAPNPAPTPNPAPAPGAGSSGTQSGGTGESGGGTVNLDTSKLESKLEEINTSINTGSANIADQVRTSGETLNTTFTDRMTDINNTISNGTNTKLEDIKNAAKNISDTLDKNNKDE